jgi:hypothetical protein
MQTSPYRIFIKRNVGFTPFVFVYAEKSPAVKLVDMWRLRAQKNRIKIEFHRRNEHIW